VLFRSAGLREDVSYEVRLKAWNCTCAAFAFGAFAGEGDGEDEGFKGGQFGGSRDRDDGGGRTERDDGYGMAHGDEMSDEIFLSRLWGNLNLGAGEDKAHEQAGEDGDTIWGFGGVTRGEKVPMCKHLLACVLVERLEELRGCVDERVVSREEMAGWAAGWGG